MQNGRHSKNVNKITHFQGIFKGSGGSFFLCFPQNPEGNLISGGLNLGGGLEERLELG